MKRTLLRLKTRQWSAGYELLVLPLACFFIIAGCTAPLRITYDPKHGAPAFALKKPFSVSLISYKDDRKMDNRKKIGAITSPVAGIDSTELIIEKEPSDIVTNAFREQLALAGFKVNVAENYASSPYLPPEGDKGGGADILMQGSVKAFKLDIASKDVIEIEIETKATDSRTGSVLWSGAVVEKNERFAGAMGNTRESINRYISASLAKIVKETLTNIASAIEKTRPHSIETIKEEIILSSQGRLALSTVPPKAQVYIDDVYYGLTPIAVDLAPGIYMVNFKLTGFKTAAQKTAIRRGRVTEFSVILEKE